MREIVEDILNSFDIKKFERLFREKCRNFSFSYEDLNIYNKDIFTQGLKLAEGKLEDDNEIIIVGFKTNKDLTERSGKKAQYELGKKILKDLMRYAGGFFIFYDEKGDFRFSFIYSIPLETGQRDWSSFRRYTYLVSKELTNNTFIKQLTEADFSIIDKIIEAFAVEKVTKEFYKELSNWYYWVMDIVEFPDDDISMKDKEIRNATNLIRLITRIIFIWFLKVKKLVPDILFNKEKLKDIVKDFKKNKESDNYYNAILQNLFFGTLNQYIKERKFATEGNYNENKQEYGIKNLYRYANKFIISKSEVIKMFSEIPFLNGGLFDCLDKYDENKKQIYVDGFSRNLKKQAKIPDYVFFIEDIKEVNLSKYGFKHNEKVRGLFEIFKSYNFTIDENSIIDQEVALDPELLGKVFENLLASYNPETKESARKSTGSYYTPREIVDYMCEQSILEYFKVKLPEIEEEKLKLIVGYNDYKPDLSESIKRKIIELISEIKIIDPACGSGAFPMGILHKLVYILEKLDPENKLWQEIQYEKAIKETEETFKIGDKKAMEERLKEINETFDENINYPDYARKLYLIENCIYGVDIQPIAIHISKLRFFISLVIDQKIDKTKENFGIKPLPNLETKFVAANTLIGLEKPSQMSLRNPEIDKKEKELKEVRHKYFLAKTRKEKIRLQEKDKKLREEISELLKEDGWGDETAQKIVNFNPYDLNKSSDWFDPEWMFGVTEGFDIVIGNPPYIQLQKDRGLLANLYKNQNYLTFERTGDIYCLFYEKGIQILKLYGHLCYITSNKWMRAAYGEKLRQFFMNYNPKILIDLGPEIFESATVDTCIFVIEKNKQDILELKELNKKENFKLQALTLTKENGRINISEQIKQKGIILNNLTKDVWFICSDAELRLKEKIEKIGVPLKDWDVKIYRGILTGFNDAFIIDDVKRKQILSKCKDKEERKRTEVILKPVLRGRDIERYYYKWAGLWLIKIECGWTNKNRGRKDPEQFFKQTYPAIYEHLISFKKYSGKGKGLINRDDQGDYWWELRECDYYDEFEKEKIVWQEIVREPQFCYDDKKFYIEATGFIMTGQNIKYILGLLNSKIITYFFKNWYSGGGLGQEGFRYKKNFLEQIPIPKVDKLNRKIINEIEMNVEKIINKKNIKFIMEIKELEKIIENLIWRLYNLTEEEIKIVEETYKGSK